MFDSFIVARDTDQPLYRQIAAYLENQIRAGHVAGGTKLLASRAAAKTLGVSRIAVVMAYDELRNSGLVRTYERHGLFVVERPPQLETHDQRAYGPLHDGDFVEAGQSDRQNTLPQIIRFSGGSLPPDFIPVEAMRAAINLVLDRDLGAALGYEPTEGYPPLRQAIADQVHMLGIETTGEQVLVTGGCQQAIDLAVQSLVTPGGAILTTDPTYIGLIDIVRTRGIQLITVGYNGESLDFGRFEQIIAEQPIHLFYVMTSFQNPTGAVLSNPTRYRLVNWATAHHIPILEDGVYDGLAYDSDLGLPLKALDTGGVVLYASGFSKTVVPGTRIGYLIAPFRLYDRIRRVKQAADICTPGLNQRAMNELLRSGILNAHLERVRRACKRRRDALDAALRDKAEGVWRWAVPKGGLYLWLHFPKDGPTARTVLASAQALGVDYALGDDFGITPHWHYALRLNFTTHSPEIIAEGVRRLWQAYITCHKT